MSEVAPNSVPSTQYLVPSTSETRLLNAEQFLVRDDNRLSELVRGAVVPRELPGFQHGEICSRLAQWIGGFREGKTPRPRAL